MINRLLWWMFVKHYIVCQWIFSSEKWEPQTIHLPVHLLVPVRLRRDGRPLIVLDRNRHHRCLAEALLQSFRRRHGPNRAQQAYHAYLQNQEHPPILFFHRKTERTVFLVTWFPNQSRTWLPRSSPPPLLLAQTKTQQSVRSLTGSGLCWQWQLIKLSLLIHHHHQ